MNSARRSMLSLAAASIPARPPSLNEQPQCTPEDAHDTASFGRLCFLVLAAAGGATERGKTPVNIVDRGTNAVALWGERGAATINRPPSPTGTAQERRPISHFDMATPRPHHPEYPAAPACASAALAESLAQYFGTRRVGFAFDSKATNTTHAWDTVDGIVEDCRDARIVGGMHFRHSAVAGEQLGRQVARRVAARPMWRSSGG